MFLKYLVKNTEEQISHLNPAVIHSSSKGR